jgi:hypothetical protein
MQSRNNLTKHYLVVLAAAMILYSVSAAPSLLWQDSGMIQYRVLNNDIKGGLGLALSHPLYYLVSIGAKYIPIGSVIRRINMVTAVASAFAIANVYLLMRLWCGKFWPAVVSALTLALSHTFWWHAAVSETYNMYLALFLAELIFFLRYLKDGKPVNIYLVGLFNGLAISVHMFAVIPLACYGIYIIYLLINHRIKTQTVLLFILFWIVGALPYEYLIVEELVRTGSFLATVRSAFFGRSWEGAVLNTAISPRMIKENIFLIGMNFPTLNIIFIIPGFYSLFKLDKQRDFGRIIAVLFVLFLLFAFRYTVADRYAFFLPFYAMTALIIGFGVCSFQQRYISVMALLLAIIPAVVYIFLPSLVENYYPVFKGARHLPYRSEYTYFLQPWKTGYYGADVFARQALEGVPENSLVFADGTSLYPLVITKQTDFHRKNVNIMSSHGSYDSISGYSEQRLLDLINSHPSYVVSEDKRYCPAYIFLNYRLVGEGVLFRIKTE